MAHALGEACVQIIAIFAIFLGACIMLVSIVQYYRALVRVKSLIYSGKVFSRWTYLLCMGLMFFFLAGYIIMGVLYLNTSQFQQSDLLIAAIFFFGAIFVYIVITVQAQMSRTISTKTNEIVLSLVNAMEAKDPYTSGHSVHVANLAMLFYKYLPVHLQARISPITLKDAAILHDIGKIGISDQILNKPSHLTEEEMAVIREHPRMGQQILQETSFSQLGGIILAHHERMDQKGYYGIAPQDIPLESRMIAIVDTFSALYSDRVYRPKKSFAEATAELGRVAGTQLDKELVEVFLSIPEDEINDATQNLFAPGYDE